MKKLMILVIATLTLTVTADAKWWIFGKSGNEVGLKYMYINKIPADETGAKIKLFKEMLGPDGTIQITGKAATGKSAVGSVRVSIDDKATWQDAKFSENGTFEYSFKPEAGKTYPILIEVTDTAGKTNKVDDTRKELTLSAENMQPKVKEVLDAMFDAYSKKDLQRLMSYVGEDFAGDKTILERAAKKDFDALSNITMRCTINNIASGAQGKIFVSITYSRLVLVNRTGLTNKDTGATEFVFTTRDGKLELYSMKQPLMFGLSDAENVASGTVLGNSVSTLVLDETGNIGGGEQVTIDCRGSGTVMKYTFATGAQACDTSGGSADIWFYDWANDIGYAVTQHKIFAKSLSSLASAEVRNLSGYTAAGTVSGAMTGYTYCFNTGTDFNCVEPVQFPAVGNDLAKFKVKQF